VTALHGRHALVTGANRGIGAAIVRALSTEGASVSLLVRDRDRGEDVARTLRGPATTVVADVTDRSAVFAACADAAQRLGPVDILVNNAGSTESKPFLRTEPALFERLFAEHVLGAVHTMQSVLPAMVERGRGRIVNVASIAGLQGEGYVSAYVAAKHALVGLTRSLAIEVGKHGIAVNAVCPGYTDTDLVHDAVRRVSTKTGRPPDDALRSIIERAGQSRLIGVDEVAAAVVALCAEPEGVPGGRTIVVDGRA
jgi:NAD(P)-dependent dehydrogenase (short-subunit alcohol dehydrogenase family)